MHAPLLVSWLLVALCAASGGYCVLRSRSRVPEQRATARGEALMGFGMAAMAVPAAAPAEGGWLWPLYTAVFGVATLVVGRAMMPRGGRTAHHAHHLVGMAAMVYMAWAMAVAQVGHTGGHAGADGTAGMAGMPASAGSPALTWLLLLYFAGYVLWAGGRLLPRAAVGAGVPGPGGTGAAGGRDTAISGPPTIRWGERPELALACRLAMGTAMVAMLLTL